MLSQNQIKHLKSLQQKKNRILHQQFIIEGEKMVNELLSSALTTLHLYHTNDFSIDSLKNKINSTCINEKDLGRISSLKTPNKALAVVSIEQSTKEITLNDYSLVLDNIQDPGNLGTIIRTADWFGINTIYCSKDTVDCYNPKVVQASMGSIYRVKVIYVALDDLFNHAKNVNFPILGAALDGDNLYQNTLPEQALIVMGNESKGISQKTQSVISHSIRIPSYPDNSNVESLNVSIATALICGELRRPKH